VAPVSVPGVSRRCATWWMFEVGTGAKNNYLVDRWPNRWRFSFAPPEKPGRLVETTLLVQLLDMVNP